MGCAAPAECDATVAQILEDGRHSRRIFEAAALSRVARAILDPEPACELPQAGAGAHVVAGDHEPRVVPAH